MQKSLFIVCLISMLFCNENLSELVTVPKVELEKYLGTWYCLATIPTFFQKEDCTAITAEYILREDGKIKVINKCRKGSVDGEVEEAIGKAWVADKKTNSKLKVQFFWPFSGDYYIFGLSEDYTYALVGEPERNYFWLLYREPKISEELYQKLMNDVQESGYDLKRIVRVKH